MIIQEFYQALSKKDIYLTEHQKKQFNQYYRLLVEWNKKMNLTAITEETEVYLKHFYDSITLAFYYDFSDQHLRLCDVGSGAGFPSIPLKIIYPDLEIHIVDSLKKRLTFLDTLTKELELSDVYLHHARAEDFGQNAEFRENFDIVTARAVARLNVLSEFCLPLVKRNGYFIAMKAAKGAEELEEAKVAIATLGGKVQQMIELNLPNENDQRFILLIEKKKVTPKKYPRKAGTPLKKPII